MKRRNSSFLDVCFTVFKTFLMVSVAFFLLIALTPSFDLSGGSQFTLWTESFAGDHDEGTHGGGHSGSGGKHLGHRKDAGDHHTGGGGGHSIEDKVFRGGGREAGSAGRHPGEDGGHSIDDKIFSDHGPGSGHEDPEHSTNDHSDHEDKDHSDAKGKGPKFMGGR